MKRWLVRGSLGLAIALVAVVLWGWIFAWRHLPYYTDYGEIELPVPILTSDEYDEVFEAHPRPFVVEIRDDRVQVLLYGASHTKDPADPQIADIESRWEEFRPTVALCESRLGILFPGLMDPLREFSEPGFVHRLARRDGIPTYTWEPEPATVMEHLLALPFSREQVALRVKLGAYFSNRRFGRPAHPEAFVEDTLDDPGRWPGLEETLPTVAAIDEAWQRHFPGGPDWREVTDEVALPGFLDRISANEARDEHFVRVIIDLARKGERVFAVAGSSHAVKLEPALLGALAPVDVAPR